jgi:small subunit ribosomal protein S16
LKLQNVIKNYPPNNKTTKMAVKIRLQRHGKKNKPFYFIVVADARSPRDGKFIEKLGTYNPNTNPATIDLNVASSLQWIKNGAQPTETAQRILSYKGVLYQKYLERGVAKGIIDQAQAETKLAEWLSAKDAKVQGKVETLVKTADKDAKARMTAEAKIKADRAAAIIKKNTPPPAEVVEEVAEVVEEVAEATEEPTAEA